MMPGEFTSGLTAEGKGGAAGRRFCLFFSLLTGQETYYLVRSTNYLTLGNEVTKK
jgi:hypothetical protein